MPNPLVARVDADGFRFRMHVFDAADVPTDVSRLFEKTDCFADRLGLTPEEKYALRIALEELITNVGKFGRSDTRGGGKLTVAGEMTVVAGELRLTIADNGTAFNPETFPPPDLDADIQEREVGGLGLYMVRELFSGHRYSRRDGWNINVWILRR